MSHFTAGCPYPHDQCKCYSELRQDVGRLTRERSEWEANEQEQYREVLRLQAIVDRYDRFFDDAFPDDPFLKGSLDGEWDAFQARDSGHAIAPDEPRASGSDREVGQ